MKNRNMMFATIFLALGLFAFSPVALAVVPPPDGGYPNFTTAETNTLRTSPPAQAIPELAGIHSSA